MKLPHMPRSVWVLGSAALLLPLTSGAIVMVAEGKVAHTRQVIERLSAEAHKSTEELNRLAATSPDLDALASLGAMLDKRRSDAQKPALVVAELSSTCERIGVRVESVRPVNVNQTAPAGAAAPAVPTPSGYELKVRSDSATLSRLLDEIPTCRLPLRVIGLRMEADERGPERAFGTMRAEITLEAYRPAVRAKKEVQP